MSEEKIEKYKIELFGNNIRYYDFDNVDILNTMFGISNFLIFILSVILIIIFIIRL